MLILFVMVSNLGASQPESNKSASKPKPENYPSFFGKLTADTTKGKGRAFRCSGALLDTGEFITAEHCILAEKMKVEFSNGVFCKIEGEARKLGNDIAILHVDKKCKLSDYDKLSIYPGAIKKGDKVTAYGFPTDLGDSNFRNCKVNYMDEKTFYTDCFTDIPYGEVNAASGGPLLFRNQLIGILSSDLKSDHIRLTLYSRFPPAEHTP